MPRAMLLAAVRKTADRLRDEIKSGQLSLPDGIRPRDFLTAAMVSRASLLALNDNRPQLRRVLNLTGVVLHTNLGRALLSENARLAINQAASGYSNLELDLQTGKRGSRYAPVEELLTKLTGAEAALVVNNNAAAVLLALSTLARGREVIVSRGQLVEIGGSFRIPEVMAQSGATLVEVGATNKTHPRDYQKAITAQTALLLHVHTSNYRILGFTRETTIAELAAIGAQFTLPVMSDLGSGSLVNTGELGLPPEPTVREVVSGGADLVTFSGDKLLGGPQAGIIVGKKKYLDPMKSNPLTRAVRIDKFTVAALEATLREYLDQTKLKQKIPVLAMLAAREDELGPLAGRLAEKLTAAAGGQARFTVLEINSAVGGGALPTADLPSIAVAVQPDQITVSELASRLRATEPALLGRLQDDALLLDVRTLQPGEEDILVEVMVKALAGGSNF
ncbi:MAG: L-seryl-tRNA(Sec) selenium transferase [Firmicutes bacterium]|nr:L-seryl-tRNA(Sec) selenium transferase [Bacillota bacterium]